MKKNNWFSVDKEGLAQILERRGKHFAIFELIQNAWDEETTSIDVTLKPVPGKPLCVLNVVDDSPEGFRDLSDAHTLFAPSYKKDDAEKRGRFNIGEKLVLAICEEAVITSTTGTVFFNRDGTRTRGKAKTEAGTVFKATIRMTREELEEACEQVKRLIAPHAHRRLQRRPEVRTSFNGAAFPDRLVHSCIDATLPTEISDSEGNMRRTNRKTTLVVYYPKTNEPAMIYEMGIPVCELPDDAWHVDVLQKVPLNMERDNITPAYLKKIRTLLLNEMHNDLDEEQANAAWVQEATSDPDCTDDAMESYLDAKFGEKRVAYDPSDPEANKRAVSEGYTVVHGRQMGATQWSNAKRTNLVPAAGTVTPSEKAKFELFGDDVGYPKEKWTPEMEDTVYHLSSIGTLLLGFSLDVGIVDSKQGFGACYRSGQMMLNVRSLGKKWFDNASKGSLVKKHDLMIHELGHEYSGDHLDTAYYKGLSLLGAKLTSLALTSPTLFTVTGDSSKVTTGSIK